jgi:DNA-binding protein YbaB
MAAGSGFGGDDVDLLFEEMRRTLGAMRSGRHSTVGSGGSEGEAAEIRGEGEAAEGWVTATVGESGQVESIRIDPRLMRSDSFALCEHIVTAVNAALADFRGKATAAMPLGVADPEALAGKLRDLQNQSVRQMASFGQAMNEVLARLGQAGR